MKSFILSIACVTLLVINGSNGRPQNKVAENSSQDEGTLPEDSYFPRDAAGNVVKPDPSRALFAGSEGFQVSSASNKGLNFRPDEDLPVILMAPGSFPVVGQSSAGSELSDQPSYGDIVPGVWTNDGSQSYTNQNQDQSQQMTINEEPVVQVVEQEKPIGEPIGLETYHEDSFANTEYQNSNPSPIPDTINFGFGANTRGTQLGRNLRALNSILNGEGSRKTRSSNYDNDESIEGVGVYKSMVIFNHLPKEMLNFN